MLGVAGSPPRLSGCLPTGRLMFSGSNGCPSSPMSRTRRPSALRNTAVSPRRVFCAHTSRSRGRVPTLLVGRCFRQTIDHGEERVDRTLMRIARSHSDRRCRVLRKQTPLPDVPPQHRHRLVPGRLGNHPLLDPSDSGGSRKARPQRVPANTTVAIILAISSPGSSLRETRRSQRGL
jgi:hypothetical protein